MPKKKTEAEWDPTEMNQVCETKNESGLLESEEQSETTGSEENSDTQTDFGENEGMEPGESVDEENGPTNPETEMENTQDEEVGPAEGAFILGNIALPDTESVPLLPTAETDIVTIAVGPEESENASLGDTESELPKKKRGRPKKKPIESESQEIGVRKTTAQETGRPLRQKPGNGILPIGDELGVELDSDKQRNDLLDLAESMNGSRVLSGYVQGIEQTEQGTFFAVIYYGTFKIIIPTEELVTLPKDIGDRDPQVMLHRLLNRRLGAEVDFIVKGVDRDSGIAVASRKEAMLRKRKRFFYDTDRDGNYRIYEDLCAEARIVSVIRNGIFVEFFGVETYIQLRELSYQRWHDATEHYQNGERVVVKVLALDKSDLQNIRVELSVKQTGKNPFDMAIKRYQRGNRYIGKTSMIIPSGVIVALDGEIDCFCRFPERGRPPIGSRVTVLVNGINLERKRVWGLILHVSPR